METRDVPGGRATELVSSFIALVGATPAYFIIVSLVRSLIRRRENDWQNAVIPMIAAVIWAWILTRLAFRLMLRSKTLLPTRVYAAAGWTILVVSVGVGGLSLSQGKVLEALQMAATGGMIAAWAFSAARSS